CAGWGCVVDIRAFGPRRRETVMFTGMLEELGEVTAVTPMGDSARLTVRGPVVTADGRGGDSIAVNGVCLTIADAPDPESFTADVMQETMRHSSLGGLEVGSPVNLERAAPVSGRLG